MTSITALKFVHHLILLYSISGTPFISNSTCLLKDNIYECLPQETVTCALDNFAPNDGWFELQWDCLNFVGSGEPPVVVTDPTCSGYGSDASSLLYVDGLAVEGDKCTCSTRGNSNCRAEVSSVEVTVKTPCKSLNAIPYVCTVI